MSGLLSISVQEARGLVAVPADIDNLAVVIGCSSLGSGLSSFFLSGQSAVADRGVGDAVDTLAQIIEQRQADGSTGAKFPSALCTTPATNPGTYGTANNSGVTGLGLGAAGAAVPLGTYEGRLKWIAGGTVGVPGMSIQWSLNGGRTYSNTTALGTATSYTIPNSGLEIDLSPSGVDLTALNTLLNELKVDMNAHFILTTGGVHGLADSGDVVATTNASSTPTRIALANALRAAYSAHRILTAGGVHGAADTTNVIVAPAATNDTEALVLALDLKAKYNAHRVLTTASVHGLADSTNATTSPAPAAGTFNSGDVIGLNTIGPAPSTSDVDAAFTALAAARADFSIVVCEFPADAAMAAHITSGLNLLRNVGKRCVALFRTRIPDFNASETEAAWAASIEADFANYTDSRVLKRASYGLVTDAMSTRDYLRSDLAQFSADVVRCPRFVWPCAPADRKMANFSLVNRDDATIGHDEGSRGTVTGLSNETLGNTFSSVQRLPIPERREDVYNTVPWVCYAADERIRNLMVRRLANAMERDAVAAGVGTLGGRLFYTGTGPTTGVLSAESVNLVHSVLYNALAEEFAGEIENAHDAAGDTGLVQVNPSVVKSGGNLIAVTATLAPKVAGFVLALTIVLAIQE